MRRKLFIYLILTLLPLAGASAQDVLEVKRVSLDQLVSFLRKEVSPRIYYVRSDEEQSSFTVSAPREQFLDAAIAELGSKGYVTSRFDSSIFILHSKAIQSSLPDGYFESGNTLAANDDGLQRFLADQNNIVTFQNKVYEIGEPSAGKSGKVTVSGHVRDVSSGEPLVGVAVYDDKTGIYTVTDASGYYRVMLPVGDNKLSFSGYSLEDMQLTLKVFDEGGLDVVMKEKVTSLSGAIVSADAISHHRNASLGLEKIRLNTAAKIPSAFGETDIIKAVLTLPGVKSVGEASSGFNVRGGSADQNLILFNDGTIYYPSHMFGIFSSFNPDVISEMELYKSSIPAEFGGRISSVLDVHGRGGNLNKFTGSLGLGLLTSRIHLEGPLAKGRTSFILGARTTYSNWMLRVLPATSEYHGGTADFSDINASISHKVNDSNSLHAYAYWSRDDFAFQSKTSFKYSNLTASVKWRSHFSSNHDMTAVVGYDRYRSGTSDKETLGMIWNPIFQGNANLSYSINIGIRQAYAKATFHSTLNDAHKLTYGAQATYYMVNPGEKIPMEDNPFMEPVYLDHEKGLEPALFASDTWTVNSRLILDGGLRLSGFYAAGDRKFYGAPELRISGKYSLQDNLSLKAGINTLRQNIHLISNSSAISPMDTWRLSSGRIRPQSGWQAATGAYWTVAGGKVDLSAEAYYKRMNHTLDYKSGSILIMNPDIADALVETYGKAYGVEIMAKKTVGKLTGWVSYTYSRSRLREKGDRGVETINRGEWYNAPYDKPHDFKLTGNYKFTHRYSMSMNIDYSTGRPVTVPIGWYKYGDGMRIAYSDRNTHRIPDYFRLDLAVNIEPSHYLRQLTHMSVTIGVYNVTGRKNAYSVFFYNSDPSSMMGSSLSGHMLSVFACPIPYINLNLKF